jgi:hypothetical protein
VQQTVLSPQNAPMRWGTRQLRRKLSLNYLVHMQTAGAGYWLLALPRPQFWLSRMVIGTVIRRQADPSRPKPACNRSRLGQLGLSRAQVSRRRWQVPGWRDRFNGRVHVVLWFIVEKKTRAPATATHCHCHLNCYKASICFRQPIRQAFWCCRCGMATVFGIPLAISIHRIGSLHVSHRETWWRSLGWHWWIHGRGLLR